MTELEIKKLSVADAIDVVHLSLTTPAQFEQLAEECSELSKATLKYARILRGDNPTPVTTSKARADITEEATDVLLCLRVCGVPNSPEVALQKMQRWVERLNKENKIKEE